MLLMLMSTRRREVTSGLDPLEGLDPEAGSAGAGAASVGISGPAAHPPAALAEALRGASWGYPQASAGKETLPDPRPDVPVVYRDAAFNYCRGQAEDLAAVKALIELFGSKDMGLSKTWFDDEPLAPSVLNRAGVIVDHLRLKRISSGLVGANAVVVVLTESAQCLLELQHALWLGKAVATVVLSSKSETANDLADRAKKRLWEAANPKKKSEQGGDPLKDAYGNGEFSEEEQQRRRKEEQRVKEEFETSYSASQPQSRVHTR
eukprot:tig00000093_g3582.t1